MTVFKSSSVAGLSPIIADGFRPANESSVSEMHRAALQGASFGLFDTSIQPLIPAALARHADLGRGQSRLTLIVPARAAPLDDCRVDDDIFTFLATPDLAARLDFDAPPETWCFQMMHSVLAEVRLNVDIAVVHQPEPTAPASARSADIDVVIPHRGRQQHLRLCVDSVLRQDSSASIVVALDQKTGYLDLLKDLRAFPRISIVQIEPCPSGPYVARHHLGHAGKGAYLLGQDSDDVSIGSRLASLLAESAATGAGIVGSHELRVHEVDHKVLAVRYPLDASAGLASAGPGHQVLFPMTVVRRDVFEAVGGFSTNRVFSLDVNFWLAASFITSLRNVDEFLYIRRRRAGSLTMRRDIGSQSPIRQRLRNKRSSDYIAVRDGSMALADSSLALKHRNTPVDFRVLKSAKNSV